MITYYGQGIMWINIVLCASKCQHTNLIKIEAQLSLYALFIALAKKPPNGATVDANAAYNYCMYCEFQFLCIFSCGLLTSIQISVSRCYPITI